MVPRWLFPLRSACVHFRKEGHKIKKLDFYQRRKLSQESVSICIQLVSHVLCGYLWMQGNLEKYDFLSTWFTLSHRQLWFLLIEEKKKMDTREATNSVHQTALFCKGSMVWGLLQFVSGCVVQSQSFVGGGWIWSVHLTHGAVLGLRVWDSWTSWGVGTTLILHTV